jgi:hypothetical protein
VSQWYRSTVPRFAAIFHFAKIGESTTVGTPPILRRAAFHLDGAGPYSSRMDATAFRGSLSAVAPPRGMTTAQRVLWLDRTGDWQGAHDIAQDMPGSDGYWLHAYLHRREGDIGNAGYWYRRAGKPAASGSLDDEWESLVEHFAVESD